MFIYQLKNLMNPAPVINHNSLEDLIKDCSERKGNYSQLVIDLVEKAEIVFAVKYRKQQHLWQLKNDVDNAVKLIDITRVFDSKALAFLNILLISKLKTV